MNIMFSSMTLYEELLYIQYNEFVWWSDGDSNDKWICISVYKINFQTVNDIPLCSRNFYRQNFPMVNQSTECYIIMYIRYVHVKEFCHILVRRWQFEMVFRSEVMPLTYWTNNNASCGLMSHCYRFIGKRCYLWPKYRFKLIHLLTRMGQNSLPW